MEQIHLSELDHLPLQDVFLFAVCALGIKLRNGGDQQANAPGPAGGWMDGYRM
jgi:hypothetical protein